MSGTGVDIRMLKEQLQSNYEALPSESAAVALESLRFMGDEYRMAREFFPGYVDCSTLVSQAHWDAAGVQTPYVAESQRLARTATVVADLEQALPGDVLVAYKSMADSPSRDHNHVGLLLTREPDGSGWVIEAKYRKGVRIIPLGEASWAGGIRRFCPNALVGFPPGGAWNGLARATPKLARLGTRLTAHYRRDDVKSSERRHLGIDVYAEPGSPVFAPVGGTVTMRPSGERRRWSVVICDAERRIGVLLAPVHVMPGVATGMKVAAGDQLGFLDTENRWYGCNRLATHRGEPHLHWELWSGSDLGYAPAIELHTSDAELARGGAQAYNPVYAVKLGVIGSPLSGL